MKYQHRIVITPHTAVLDNESIATIEQGEKLITELYRARVGDYPKFFKMDMLSRLGFIASELLLKRCARLPGSDEETGVILFNHHSSLNNDVNYQATISNGDYFPSPALFVYTLPNIVTGEIAIRNKFYGETAFYLLPCKDEREIESIIADALGGGMKNVLGGWLEYIDAENFEADLRLYSK